jgi:hypothetical protein
MPATSASAHSAAAIDPRDLLARHQDQVAIAVVVDVGQLDARRGRVRHGVVVERAGLRAAPRDRGRRREPDHDVDEAIRVPVRGS